MHDHNSKYSTIGILSLLNRGTCITISKSVAALKFRLIFTDGSYCGKNLIPYPFNYTKRLDMMGDSNYFMLISQQDQSTLKTQSSHQVLCQSRYPHHFFSQYVSYAVSDDNSSYEEVLSIESNDLKKLLAEKSDDKAYLA